MTRIRTATALLLLAVPMPASTSAGAPTWVVAPPVPLQKGAVEGVLRSVTVLTPQDVWAVGGWTDTVGVGHTLAVHWDGADWMTVPTPDSTDPDSEYGLNAVDSTNPRDVWAVGDVVTVGSTAKKTPLLLRYDGIRWAEESAPAGVDGELTDIDLLTADEGWAVGDNEGLPVILRRSGGFWFESAVPRLGVSVSLESVYATSPTDVWVVGTQLRDGQAAGLVLHWDGVEWAPVGLPSAGSANEALTDIAAASATDVWAVGAVCTPVCSARALHLSAGTWQPEAVSPAATLTSIVAFSPTDVWIFGQSTAAGIALDHIEHWNGTEFTVDTSVPAATPNPHHPASALALAAAAADHQSGTIWTVGWIQGIDGKTTHALYRS